MTTKTINKRAFQEIRFIETANNMVIIEHLIYQAIENVFKTSNLGLLKINMVNQGIEDNFDFIVNSRLKQKEIYKNLVREYLISKIPVRFHNTIMYKKLTQAD